MQPQGGVITKSAFDALELGKNGSYSNEGNVLQHQLWDMQEFAATTVRANTRFFTQPIGSGTKQLTETNLIDPGKLPNGQTFLIREIGLSFIAGVIGTDVDANTVIAAYINIIQNSTFDIVIAGREFDWQSPGSSFLNAIQIAGRNTVVTATDRNVNVGEFLFSGWQNIKSTPIPIGQLVSFSVRQQTASGIAALQTIINTASDVLATQDAQLQVKVRGILTRAI